LTPTPLQANPHISIVRLYCGRGRRSLDKIRG